MKAASIVKAASIALVISLAGSTSCYRVEFCGLRAKTDTQYMTCLELPDGDLTPLAELRELRQLSVVASPVRDLRPLSHLTKLETLIFRKSEIRDLSPLAALPGLDYLDVSESRVSDFSPVCGVPSLLIIEATDTKMLTKVDSFAGCFASELRLSGTRVSKLTPLIGMQNLGHLNVERTLVTKEEVDAFRSARPDVEVWSDHYSRSSPAKP